MNKVKIFILLGLAITITAAPIFAQDLKSDIEKEEKTVEEDQLGSNAEEVKTLADFIESAAPTGTKRERTRRRTEEKSAIVRPLQADVE